MERLVKDGILPSLDFTDFVVCIDCIKRKQTRLIKKTATRSFELLELIDIGICGKMHVPCYTIEEHPITL